MAHIRKPRQNAHTVSRKFDSCHGRVVARIAREIERIEEFFPADEYATESADVGPMGDNENVERIDAAGIGPEMIYNVVMPPTMYPTDESTLANQNISGLMHYLNISYLLTLHQTRQDHS